jgi:outer membrane protein OmpA-like peptidoglycan-associated protein
MRTILVATMGLLILSVDPRTALGNDCEEKEKDCGRPVEFLGSFEKCDCYLCEAGASTEWTQCTESDRLKRSLARLAAGELLPKIEQNRVYFASNSAQLPTEALPHLPAYTGSLFATLGWTLVIEGYADAAEGPEAAQLAQQRASAVRQHLVEQGFPGAQIQTIGFGESRPIPHGRDETAQQQNRRAELRVVE